MTENLAEVQRSLGRIEGDLKNFGSQCETLFKKFDRANEELIEQRGQIKLLASQSTEAKILYEATIKPVLEDFKSLKNRGIGMVFGVSLASGSVGAGVATILARLIGNPGPHSP